jgi:ParB/RepB/Spo0J family partition protein
MRQVARRRKKLMNVPEINQLDLRYESSRLKDRNREGILLSSIAEKGIQEPLQGIIGKKNVYILLDGFKRLRCAKRLGMTTIPFTSIADEEVMGILQFIRVSNAKSLNILEQAKFVDVLKSQYKMSVREIAEKLERSNSWVSARLGILGGMSETVRKEIFSGRFPAYSYTYTLQHFRRLNEVKKSDIDEFVQAVSGKKLSIRNIELLAHGFFKGSNELKEQIKKGDFIWTLDQMKKTKLSNSSESAELGVFEQRVIKDLEIIQKYMNQILYKIQDKKLKSPTFMAQANLLAGGILSKRDLFIKTLEEFYARSGSS